MVSIFLLFYLLPLSIRKLTLKQIASSLLPALLSALFPVKPSLLYKAPLHLTQQSVAQLYVCKQNKSWYLNVLFFPVTLLGIN